MMLRRLVLGSSARAGFRALSTSAFPRASPLRSSLLSASSSASYSASSSSSSAAAATSAWSTTASSLSISVRPPARAMAGKPAFVDDARYLQEGEDYVEPKRGVIEGALVTSSMILERTPVLFPRMTDWELELDRLEHEAKMRGAIRLPKDLENGLYGRTADELDQEEDEEVTSVATADDVSKDHRSLYRALDEPLYLLVKVKTSAGGKQAAQWQFPRGEWREGETVRATAERTLFFHLGEDVQHYVLGNAPVASREDAPSKQQQKDFPTAKTVKHFFMHSLYLRGKVELEEDGDVLDYAWVRKQDLGQYFTGPDAKDLLDLCERILYFEPAKVEPALGNGATPPAPAPAPAPAK